eukprot:681434-Amphidinium_carterae.1
MSPFAAPQTLGHPDQHESVLYELSRETHHRRTKVAVRGGPQLGKIIANGQRLVQLSDPMYAKFDPLHVAQSLRA